MELNKVSVNLMVALIFLLDLKKASVFDTHSVTMGIFCVIFAIHGILLLAHDQLVQQQQHPNAYFVAILSRATLCFGSLGVVLPHLMILAVLGWSLLVLWVICVAKFVLNESYVIFRLLLSYQVLQAILTSLQEMTRLQTLVRKQSRASV